MCSRVKTTEVEGDESSVTPQFKANEHVDDRKEASLVFNVLLMF